MFFDWISPLLAIGDNLMGKKTVDAAELEGVQGMTGKQIERALKNAGVKTGTSMWVNGHLLMTVDDAEKAKKALGKK